VSDDRAPAPELLDIDDLAALLGQPLHGATLQALLDAWRGQRDRLGEMFDDPPTTRILLDDDRAALTCGSGKAAPTEPAPATATKPPAAAAPTAPTTPATRPTIGSDECCCPLASAEDVAFNISPKAACEAAGSECVEAARCSE